MRWLSICVLFALGAGSAIAVDGFSFAENGVETPRGLMAWNDVIALRFYNRPEQKHKPAAQVEAKVRRRTANRVVLDCFEPVSQTYVPVELVLDDTYLRVRFVAGEIVEPLGACWRLMQVEVAPIGRVHDGAQQL